MLGRQVGRLTSDLLSNDMLLCCVAIKILTCHALRKETIRRSLLKLNNISREMM